MSRNVLLSLLKKYFPGILLIAALLFVFQKVVFQGLVPFPGDLLVSYFFPYNGGGWEGFVQYVAHKEFISADVVRQIYPWRILSMDIFKQSTIPLWNPYSFSGTPLLANIQSAVFYPLNLLFFLFEEKLAWNIYIILQPILGAYFMYLFMRSLKLSPLAGIFAGLAFGFIGYNIVWFELGVVGHTALWLPLSLWGITRYSETQNKNYNLVTALALTMSLIAGHMQTAVYVYLISFAYTLFLPFSQAKTKPQFRLTIQSLAEQFSTFWVFLLPFGLAAIQILPSLELLRLSARDIATSVEVFYKFQIAPNHLVMLLAPDFFGNPAGKNFWGIEYDEFLASIGVVALLFTTVALFQRGSDRRVKFFFIVAMVALLFALPTWFSSLLQILNVPILGTGLPSRAIFVLEFAFVVLAGFGVNELVERKISLKPIIFLGTLYGILWLLVFSGINLLMASGFEANLAIAKRNLILPTALFLAAAFILFLTNKKPSLRFIAIIVCIFLAAFEYQYQVYKYLPFAPASFMFPTHPLVTYLQKETPPYRFYGYDTARIETNFSSQYKIFSIEGYDPLYIRRYGELIYGAEKGKYETLIPRSDAVLTASLPLQDTPNKQKMMNMLGVKYILEKNDGATGPWEPDTGKYPSERFKLHWQKGKYKVYENVQSLPRSAVFYNWQTITDDEQALNVFLKKDFPYQSTLVLSEQPPFQATASGMITPARILAYRPNEVVIESVATASGMLFLSDAYYPGWQAYVDTVKTKIYRSNYALRAVPVTAGKHTVVMRYEPMSFYIGVTITSITALLLAVGMLWRNPIFSKKHAKKTSHN